MLNLLTGMLAGIADGKETCIAKGKVKVEVFSHDVSNTKTKGKDEVAGKTAVQASAANWKEQSLM